MTEPVTVYLRGPLFKSEAGKAAKKALNKLIIEVSKDAVREVKGDLTIGHGKETGEFRRGIKRKKKGLRSTIFADHRAKGAWLEGTSKLNRRSRFKGYRIFGRAFERVDRTSGEDARKAGQEIVRELGGR